MSRRVSDSDDDPLLAVRAEAEPFLKALYGDWQRRALSGFIEVRIIGSNSVRSLFLSSVEAALDALPHFKKENEAGRNIYMGVNPRCRKRGREDDVQHVVALHVDVDKQAGPSAADLVKLGDIEPSIVIESGHGRHLYWLLQIPLEVTDNTIRARVRGINLALALAFQGDHACHDLGRVLRIPGFTNVKDPTNARPVSLGCVNPVRRYELDDFAFLHPAPLPAEKLPPGSDASVDAPEISQRLDTLLESDPDVRRRFDGDVRGLNDKTSSGIDFSLASLLSHRGCNFEEFIAALKFAPYNRSRGAELTPKYMRRTWARAQAKEKSKRGSNTFASEPKITLEPGPPSLTFEQARAMLPDVLAETAGFLRTYLAISDEQVFVLAVWIFHTHAIDAADCTPYLHISSPEKRAGKTRLLEVICLLTRKAWFTSNASAAALARVVADKRPTALLDEADTLFKTESERSETLRGILNAGFQRGGTYSRCVGQGGSIRVENLDVFGPKAIAGLNELPDTIADRSIPIRMRRALPGEIRQRYYRRDAESLGTALRARIEECASVLVPCLKDVRPRRIDQLNDRQFDIAEPLLAVGDVAANGWPERLQIALLGLFAPQPEEESLSIRLLADIREIFQPEGVVRIEAMATEGLLKSLCALEDAPWNEYSRGKPVNSHNLAKLLGRFGIRPDKWRADQRTVRGYTATVFADAWARYLRAGHSWEAEQSATAPQPFESEGSENKACGGVADHGAIPDRLNPERNRGQG